MGRKPKNPEAPKPSQYFGPQVDEAIAEFNAAESRYKKENIFNSVIYPAFNKLVENVIHNRQFYNYQYDDYSYVKHECVIHLYERLKNFNPDRGSSAFSYFNRVTIHWVYAKYNNLKKQGFDHSAELEDIDNERDIMMEISEGEYASELEDFCNKWSKWGIAHLDYFYFVRKNQIVEFTLNDKKIAEAIFDIFKDIRNIDIFEIDKRQLYFMIRDRTGCDTNNVTEVIKVLKQLCKKMFVEFRETGTAYWHRHLYYPEEFEFDLESIAESNFESNYFQ